MSAESYRERCDYLRREIDRQRRERLDEEDARRFVRGALGGYKSVSRERLFHLRNRENLTDAQIETALETLGIVLDSKGYLRYPAELQPLERVRP